MNRPFNRRSMVAEFMAREPFRVGNSIIEPISREARWDGGEERLQPQTLKVLILLAGRRGEVVTRDEIAELCWDGRIVGDDVINRSISLLRQFAERAGGFSIQTVPRAGYRLNEGSQNQASILRWNIVAAGLVLLLAVLGSVTLLRPSKPTSSTLTIGIQPFASSGDEGSKRIAAEVQEASIRILTDSGTSVVATNGEQSSKASPDFLLSATVGRRAGLPMAMVRLEDPRRHAIVLSRQIEAQAADPTALPDQVGANLAAALSWALPLVRIDQRNPSDPAFLANILKTRETNFDSQASFEFLRRHAPNAPNSAIAQLSLAMLTGMNLADLPAGERARALATGQDAAERAISLAPSYGDGEIPWCMLHAEVRLAECERHLRRGMAADHGAPFSGAILSHLLLNVGRIEEANSVATEVLAKDMYVPNKIAESLISLEAAGRTREADSLYRRGHRLWPNYRGLLFKRVSGMLARADFEALSKLEGNERAALPAGFPSLATPLAKALREHSLPLARKTCRHIADDDLPVIQCMLALARLGELDEAFRLAERIYPRRTGHSSAEEEALWLSNPDNLDTVYISASGAAPLRRDPRFLVLADRLGLLRYWRSGRPPDFCARHHELICDRIFARE